MQELTQLVTKNVEEEYPGYTVDPGIGLRFNASVLADNQVKVIDIRFKLVKKPEPKSKPEEKKGSGLN